ncbi:MAG TPA: hypothetical protein DEO70_07190 [Bacteroidales bacterium]|nr:MAG: hypothetical protein A2X11_06805 [Bacteroidetes bacterium GWE2_42_24]OFY25982.1 MAG: hypothetical protein A2X09_04790 [Bacteroidetes bacterium GWF2_43_11]PKP23602.1 MAG: hypothetical protein CVU06_07440 [Bacteroidetes bacterium HGW-Bacteroidetes-22]HBZ66606.1 hypothetical protein [Bacteroidales bacterium]
METFISIGFTLTYILLAVAVVALIVFPVYFMVTNLKKAKTGLLALLALVVLFAFAIGVSPAEQGAFYSEFQISPTLSRVIGGGLLGFYLLFAAAIITAVYSELSKWFK